MSNKPKPKNEPRLTLPVAPLPSATSAAPPITKDFFRDLFIHSDSTVTSFQKPDGDYIIYDNSQFSDADIVSHMSGSTTMGLPIMHSGVMKFCLVDLDIKKEYHSKPDFLLGDYLPQIEEQRQLYARHAGLFGLADRLYWEHSGFKGMHGWFFFEKYLPVSKVRAFLYGVFGPDLIPPVSEAIHTDFFPKSSNADAKVLIRGPWGINRKSGKRSSWITPFPTRRDDVRFVTEAELDRVVSPLNSITLNCTAVRLLALKAVEKGHLEHDERFALADIYKEFGKGKLAGDGIGYLIDTFISHCSDFDRAYTQSQVAQISKTGYKPVTCAYMQEHRICKGQCKLIGRNKSPMAFPYRVLGDYTSIELMDEYEGRYSESWLVKKFVADCPNLLFSVPEKNFYEYQAGVWKKLADAVVAARVESFMMAHCKAAEVTNKRVEDVTKRLTKVASLHFDGTWNHELLKINLKNGVLDVPSMVLLPHDATYHFTHQLPFDYDPQAVAPAFTRFFREILEPADPQLTATPADKQRYWDEKVAFMLDWLCYSFFNDYSCQKILNLVGMAGRNGKSRLAMIWERVIGPENVWHEDLVTLAKEPFAKANLFGKLLNISTDLRITDALDMTELKRLSGGDPVVGNIKFKPHLSFLNKARLVALSNEVPRLGEIKPATLERFQFLEFEQSFLGEKADTGLDEKLQAELPGIFNVVMHRFPHIRRPDGSFFIQEPEVVRLTLQKFMSGLHNVLEFADAVLVKDDQKCVAKVTLYERYKDWAKDNGYGQKPLSSRKFKEVLVGAGYRIDRSKRYDNREFVFGYRGVGPYIYEVMTQEWTDVDRTASGAL